MFFKGDVVYIIPVGEWGTIRNCFLSHSGNPGYEVVTERNGIYYASGDALLGALH